MDDDSEQLARFEEIGEEAVRVLALTAGFNTAHQRLAAKWLAQKDQESKRRKMLPKQSKSTLRAPLKMRLGRLLVLPKKPI